MESGIYIIRNLATEKVYVGSTINFNKRWQTHKTNLKKNKHSSIKLQRSYNKHGLDKFVFEIIERIPYDKEIIIEREDFFIKTYNSKVNGYNIADAAFGDVLSTHPNKTEIIKKMSTTINKNISAMSKEERSKKWGKPGKLNGMYGKTHTPEVRKLISEINKGRIAHNKGKTNIELYGEEKGKLLNKKISESAKKRIGDKNPFYGKTHSEETKLKLSKINKTRFRQADPEERANRNPQIRTVIIEGKKYFGVSEAARQLNVCPATICYRIKSKNFNYKYGV